MFGRECREGVAAASPAERPGWMPGHYACSHWHKQVILQPCIYVWDLRKNITSIWRSCIKAISRWIYLLLTWKTCTKTYVYIHNTHTCVYVFAYEICLRFCVSVVIHLSLFTYLSIYVFTYLSIHLYLSISMCVCVCVLTLSSYRQYGQPQGQHVMLKWKHSQYNIQVGEAP